MIRNYYLYKHHHHSHKSRGQFVLELSCAPDNTLSTGQEVKRHDGTAKQDDVHVKHAHDCSALLGSFSAASQPQDSVTGKSGNIVGNHLTPRR